MCLYSRHKEEESTSWTTTPESWCPIRGKYSPKDDFSTPGHCLGVCTCYEGERATKQLRKGLCSTSNCKNIPEFSAICCHSGFSSFLKMRASSLCNAPGGQRKPPVTQPGFPLKPAGASASAKLLGRAVIRMQTLLWLDTTWGTGLHTEASLNLKIVKTPSKQRFEQHFVIGSLTASFSKGGKIILGCGIVLY